MANVKKSIKTITIITAGVHTYQDGSYIDFYISINGEEPDADLYRIYSWENEFHKILGFTGYGHAIRGNARKSANELILNMRKNACPVGTIEL